MSIKRTQSDQNVRCALILTPDGWRYKIKHNYEQTEYSPLPQYLIESF
jgi:hypothetical protein